MIAVSFAFEGGSAQDPAGKAGVAYMLSGLLDEAGRGRLDSRAFQTAPLDEYSIGLSFDASRDTFSGSLRTLSAIAATRPCASPAWLLTEPRFGRGAGRAHPLADHHRHQVAGERDPGEIASRAMMEAVFGGHPYAAPLRRHGRRAWP